MPVKTLAAATALIVVIGVPVAAETWAGARLDASVRTAVHHLAPGTTIIRVDPHGRPFLASLLHGGASSAYADVRGPQGTTSLILQRLHLGTGRVDTVLWFTRLPQPPGLLPVRTPGGAYTPRGTITLDGKHIEVSYQATVNAGTVTVRPTGIVADGRPANVSSVPTAWQAALAPPPVRVPAAGPLTVRAVSVGEDGITVELRQAAADTSRPAASTPSLRW